MHDLLTINPKRVRNLFCMDLHRMLHGKAFYVMAGIAVFIPVMMLTQMSGEKDIMMFIGGEGNMAGSFGAGMSLSMLNILTGMLLSIYIGREYTTGFVKNIITAHANKFDYIISKGLIALICNVIFMAVYLVTLFALGMLMGVAVEIPSIVGLALYILEKLLLSIPMSLQMGLRMLGFSSLAGVLNFTISGASSFATLTPNVLSIFVIIGITVVWSLLCSLAGDCLMNQRNVL